jgi:hypothetical protein
MAIASHPRLSVDVDHPEMALLAAPTHQAYRVLHVGFVVLPLIAGVDKFFNTLCHWTQYLAPVFPNLIGVSKQTFMLGVGVIEIVAALLVLVVPRIGGWVVMAWLWGIIINLLTLGGYYDVALRDFGLSLGAFALARLAYAHHLRRDVGEVEVKPVTPPL